MASAPQPISWRKSPIGRGDPSSPSRVRQMLRRKPLLAARLLRGPEGPTRCRRSRSTRRSSLQTGATSCRWRSRPSARAVVLSRAFNQTFDPKLHDFELGLLSSDLSGRLE